MPGLIDAHVHLALVRSPMEIRNEYDWMYVGSVSGDEARRMLFRGFTTVRDAGGPVLGLARAIDEGLIPGPRIYPSGAFITQTAGHGDWRNRNELSAYWSGDVNMFERLGWALISDGVDEVMKATRENLRVGAAQIKVMAGGGISSVFDPLESTQYTLAELSAAVKAAADWGTYVLVHAYTSEAIERALQAGVKSIEHGQLINGPTMALLAEKGAFLSSQVYINKLFRNFAGLTEHQRAKARRVVEGLDNEMRLAKKHNVKMAFGTDLFPGRETMAQQNKEFGARSEWFAPGEILRQATSVNAELLALSGPRNPYPGKLGVIEENAYADLLIVDGNPLEDIRVLEDPKDNLRLIMKDGQIYKNTLE
jgi:imidazolonepropionase-like amidohydrolase